MAGILNPKTRIMDFIITRTGRQEYRDGGLEFKFISFSDDGVFYDTDDGTVARDASTRIMMEACSLPRDTIIPEFDPGGSISVSIPAGQNLVNNRLFNSGSKTMVTGTMNLYSGSQEVMRSAKEHFNWLRSIGTRNIFTVDDDFLLGIPPTNQESEDDGLFRAVPGTYVKFQYPSSNTSATAENDVTAVGYVSNLPPMLADPRFSHIANYRPLTPFIHDKVSDTEIPLGLYPDLGGQFIAQLTKEHVRRDIHQTMARLNLTDIPYDDNYNLTDYEKNKGFPPHAIFRDTTDLISHAYVPFTEVSDDNNLLMQMFAQNGENVEKLVLVDAGQFPPDDPEWAVHPDSIGTRFIHAGKIVRGESGIPKFIRIFTLEFS